MKISKYFSYDETINSSTALRFGIDNTPDDEQKMNLIEAAKYLDEVRELLGHPIHIDSWLRKPILNIAVGGANKSAHCSGWAIDFTCPGYGSPLEIVTKISSSGINFDQLINEGNWVHISFAPKMRKETLSARFIRGQKTIYTAFIPSNNITVSAKG